jgi:hypothetical protein
VYRSEYLLTAEDGAFPVAELPGHQRPVLHEVRLRITKALDDAFRRSSAKAGRNSESLSFSRFTTRAADARSGGAASWHRQQSSG